MTERTTVENRDPSASGPDELHESDRSESQRSIDQRRIAERRGMSEAELVAEQAGINVVRLRTDWELTLHRLGAVGPVIGLTGNHHATIESVAVYRNIATRGPAAQVSDGDTDLCLFLSEWRTGFALTEGGSREPRRSLQFFDAGGSAVHKVFLREDSDVDAFDELVDRQASENQRAPPVFEVAPGQPPSDQSANAASDSGSDLGDRDGSLPVVDSIDVAPADLFAGPMWSRRVATASIRQVLSAAIASEAPLLIMVGNHGAIQNHAGPVGGLRQVDGRLAIVNGKFNLHLDESGVASAWVVRKSTPDRVVTSLELYDRAGEMVVYLAHL